MKNRITSFIWFLFLLSIGTLLCAEPSDALYVRLSYKRSTSELELKKVIVHPIRVSAEYNQGGPTFLGQTVDEEGHLLAEAKIISPMFLSVPPNESGDPPPISIIELDEATFSFIFPYIGVEKALRVYEIVEEAEPVLLGEVELP